MTQSNNVLLREKAMQWFRGLPFDEQSEKMEKLRGYKGHPRNLTGREIETIYLKEHPTEVEVSKEEETHNPLLADCLSKYIYNKHTQEECTGFIDGFKAAQEKDRVLIEELLQVLKNVSECNNTLNIYTDRQLINHCIEISKQALTKAEQYFNNQ